MSLDKGIKYHKEHRHQYYGVKAFDPSCRNHGSDDYEMRNRLFSSTKRIVEMKLKGAEYGFYIR